MEAVVALTLATMQVTAVLFLLNLTPVAITVATIASWRQSVPRAGLIALGGVVYCVWLLIPVDFALEETRLLSQWVTVLGWVWLVMAWGRHVLTEWPVPMWGHWLAGTVLVALPIAFGIAALTP